MSESKKQNIINEIFLFALVTAGAATADMVTQRLIGNPQITSESRNRSAKFAVATAVFCLIVK